MTSTETTTRSILDVTVSSRRSSAVKIITDFRETIAAGRIADAIKWSGIEVIVAEQVVELLDAFDELRGEGTPDEEALEYLAYRREDAERQLGWFDPTSQSTSAASTLVDQAQYKARRRVLELADELLGSAALDAE
jgi:hypothetical protein